MKRSIWRRAGRWAATWIELMACLSPAVPPRDDGAPDEAPPLSAQMYEILHVVSYQENRWRMLDRVRSLSRKRLRGLKPRQSDN